MGSTEAPGRLEMVREFVNTLEFSGGPEESYTAGPDELEAWCTKSGLCAAIDEEGLGRLRAFREALRNLLEAHLEAGDEPGLWQALEPFAPRACYEMAIDPQGGVVLQPQGAGADRVIAQVFAAVYDAIGAGTWKRLKACRKHTCRFAFYDRSKNGSGVWCSMQVCGNRVKAQRRRLSLKKASKK